MSEHRTYHFAGTSNPTLCLRGTWPGHDAAVAAARDWLNQCPRESWIRVKCHQHDRDWAPVAIVYRHRVSWTS